MNLRVSGFIFLLCANLSFARAQVNNGTELIDREKKELQTLEAKANLTGNEERHLGFLRDKQLLVQLDAQLKDEIAAQIVKFPQSAGALNNAQATWTKFRETDAEYQGMHCKGGRSCPSYIMARKVYLTKQRLYQLKTPFGTGWKEP